jgi:hypothetical protein
MTRVAPFSETEESHIISCSSLKERRRSLAGWLAKNKPFSSSTTSSEVFFSGLSNCQRFEFKSGINRQTDLRPQVSLASTT